MILTVSPNMSLDRVVVVRDFKLGRQSRALFGFCQPGGSGVHASLIIQVLGGETLALGLLGGLNGQGWRQAAEERNLSYDVVAIEGESRQSYCIVDEDQGSLVESVEAGPAVSEEAINELMRRLERYIGQAQLLIVSGSLPPGLPMDSYARMIALAHRYRVPTLADIYSEPLRLAASEEPWLIKPNLTEFHALLGKETFTLDERAEACRNLQGVIAGSIALSMGGEGLLLTTDSEQWLFEAPQEPIHLPNSMAINTIGCGDALVGALAYEFIHTGDLVAAARMGLAAAHANLGTYGVPEIDPGLVRRLVPLVRIDRIDRRTD